MSLNKRRRNHPDSFERRAWLPEALLALMGFTFYVTENGPNYFWLAYGALLMLFAIQDYRRVQ